MRRPPLPDLPGIKVVIDDLLEYQVNDRPQRPHRRRRIQKKWLKRFGWTFKTVKDGPYMLGNSTLVCAPSDYAALKERLG